MDIPEKPEHRIWREVQRSQRGLLATRNHEPFRTHLSSVQVVGLWALVFVIVLDSQILLDDSLPDPFFSKLLGVLFFFLLPACMATGWIVNARLAFETPHDQSNPLWFRLFRWVIACFLPYSSLSAPPIWKRIHQKVGPWANPNPRQRLQINLRNTEDRLPHPPIAFRFFGSASHEYLGILGMMAPVAGIASLSFSEGPVARNLLLTVSILAHALAFVCSSALIEPLIWWTKGSRWHYFVRHFRWLTLLPGLCLLPLLFIFQHILGADLKSLVYSAYTDRYQTRRHTAWRNLERMLGLASKTIPLTSFWSLRKRTHPHDGACRIAEERRVLFRFKTAFLLPETGLLFWLAASHTRFFSTDDKVVLPFLVWAFGLVFASVALSFLPWLASMLRWNCVAESTYPYLKGGYLLLPTAAFLIGIGGGLFAARGGIQEIAIFLQPCVMGLLLLLFVQFLHGFSENPGVPGLEPVLLWFPLLVALDVFRIILPMDPKRLGLHLAISAPILGLLAGLTLISPLLRPFTWRDIFNRCLPTKIRALLAVFILTAILPFGGLAVPFWIWARHRLWPRYEQFAEVR